MADCCIFLPRVSPPPSSLTPGVPIARRRLLGREYFGDPFFSGKGRRPPNLGIVRCQSFLSYPPRPRLTAAYVFPREEETGISLLFLFFKPYYEDPYLPAPRGPTRMAPGFATFLLGCPSLIMPGFSENVVAITRGELLFGGPFSPLRSDFFSPPTYLPQISGSKDTSFSGSPYCPSPSDISSRDEWLTDRLPP